VEPERFASLRPPTYGGAMSNPGQPQAGATAPPAGALGAVGGLPGGSQTNLGIAAGNNQTNLGMQGGVNYAIPPFNFNRYQAQLGNLGGQIGNLGGQTGLQGGFAASSAFLNDVSSNTLNFDNGRKLTFEQLQQRKQELQNNKDNARKIGKALAMLDPTESVASVASAEDIGDVCQYVIEDRVSLPRQKSAMLPIVKQPIDATKVS